MQYCNPRDMLFSGRLGRASRASEAAFSARCDVTRPVLSGSLREAAASLHPPECLHQTRARDFLRAQVLGERGIQGDTPRIDPAMSKQVSARDQSRIVTADRPPPRMTICVQSRKPGAQAGFCRPECAHLKLPRGKDHVGQLCKPVHVAQCAAHLPRAFWRIFSANRIAAATAR